MILEKRVIILLTLGVMVILPIVTVQRGQDINWDQLNYHFYLPYALFRGDFWRDMAPSQIQTWFNPLGYIPQYLLARQVDSVSFKIILTVTQALNAPLIFLIAMRLQIVRDARSMLFAGLATLVGMTAATVLGEAGTTFFDIYSAILVSGSILFCLIALDERAHRPVAAISIAGILMGAAVGLKFVNGVYPVAAAIALATAGPWRRALVRTSIYGVAAGAGFLLTAGWWMVIMWQQMGNPFFPYFNSLFGSMWLDGVPPYLASGTGADTHFLPASLKDAVRFPLRQAKGDMFTGSEFAFRDARFLVASMLGMALVVKWSWQWLGKRAVPAIAAPQWFVVVFCATSYVIWLFAFAIQRYLLPIEILTGVLIMVLIQQLLGRYRGTLSALVAVTVLLGASTRVPDYGTVPFRPGMILTADDLHGIDRPHALYVMVGREPMAYVVTALPHDARVVRIDGSLPLDPHLGLGRVASRTIAAHPGPVMVLSAGALTQEAMVALAKFELRRSSDCGTAMGLGQILTACRAFRTGEYPRPIFPNVLPGAS